jgi:hypothetical protein
MERTGRYDGAIHPLLLLRWWESCWLSLPAEILQVTNLHPLQLTYAVHAGPTAFDSSNVQQRQSAVQVASEHRRDGMETSR